MEASLRNLPTRYTNVAEQIRKRHGACRADKVAEYLIAGDPPADDVLALFSKRRQEDAQRHRVDAQRARADAQMLQQALDQGSAAVPQAPPEVRELIDRLEHQPKWLDWKLLELGARTHLRCGAACGLVLGCCSLPLAYRSAAGNKPLAYTGKLIDKRASQRLMETGRFFIETCASGGLQPHAPGWKRTVKVRMMHAQMRRNLRTKKWQQDDWGAPINQLDLAGTGLLFSACLLHHLRQIGFHFSAAESEGVMHLWRYSSHLLGVEPDLLCASESEGRELLDLILDMNSHADGHSRDLTSTLMEYAMPKMVSTVLPWLAGASPEEARMWPWPARFGNALAQVLGVTGRGHGAREKLAVFCYGLSHGLLGDRARGLPNPQTVWRYRAPRLLRSLITPLEVCRRLVPGGTGLASSIGARQFQRIMPTDSAGPASSALPTGGASVGAAAENRAEATAHARGTC
ncbi:MAG TPA: oxygenase MpaB family protein [Gemmataceae bacterium]|nr:oxygenase MpaB family protein [Gemmataceae bacterium]